MTLVGIGNILNYSVMCDNEKKLVERAKDGDFNAFESLIADCENHIYGLAMNILKKSEEAEDIVQTTFLDVLESIEDFRGEASFKTWISRIAVNNALKKLRKRKGLDTVSLEEDIYDVKKPDRVRRWIQNPREDLEQKQLRKILRSHIQSLPDKYRIVFVLRDIEGFSTRETAEMLDITESNVGVRLLRARMALREGLSENFGERFQEEQEQNWVPGSKKEAGGEDL